MLKNKMSKLVAIASTVTLMATLVTGCAAKPKTTTTDTSNLAAKQVVRYNLAADPKTVDPGLNDAVDGATVICNAFEGLMRLDAKDKPIPGVAESYKVSADQMTYTFKLKKDAVWSDGVAVKASDFVYAWTRVLDPATASTYAYQMYYIKNGQGYNESALPAAQKTPGVKPATAAELGVVATDDSTLVVTLENPTSYFISLMAFPTYAPVRKDIIDAHPKDWALNPATYVVNGPFMMKSWVAKDTLTFVKNPKYWNAKAIKLNEIDYRLLDDETAYTNAFKAGEIDFIESPPQEETQQMLADGTAKLYPYLGTYYIELNVVPEQAKLSADAQKVLKDPNIRKALSMAIDRTALIKNVTKANQLPALAFVPSGIPDPSTGKDFRAEKNYISKTADVAGAQKLLADAGYPG
ncbi:MAG TPA: peptide ABC transporter substrate-binding protein, partial [Clostridiaceae bacterium]